jgi:hypothetical protein
MEKTNERKLKKKLAPCHRRVKKSLKKTMTRALRRVTARETLVDQVGA